MKKRKRQGQQAGGGLRSPGGAAGTPGVGALDSSVSREEMVEGVVVEGAAGENDAVPVWDDGDGMEPEELEAAMGGESGDVGEQAGEAVEGAQASVSEEGVQVAAEETAPEELLAGERPPEDLLPEELSPEELLPEELLPEELLPEELLSEELLAEGAVEGVEEPQVSEEMEALLAELSAAATAGEEARASAEAGREEVLGGELAGGTEGLEGLLSELLSGEEPAEEVEAAAGDDLEAIPEPGAFESLEGVPGSADGEIGEPELFLAEEGFEGSEEEIRAARAAEPEGVVVPARNLSDVVAAIDGAIANAPNMVSHAFGGAAQLVQQKQPLEDYVVFSMAEMDYALPIEDVLEIGSLPLITRVPSLPEFVRGIMNHRGEVITVLSLPLLFGYAEPSSGRARILLVRPKNRSYTAALLVEEVKGIQRIPSQQLQRAPRAGTNRTTAVLRGLHGGAERTLGVMDLGKLFVLPEVRQLEPQ